jgi:hypothetical protein
LGINNIQILLVLLLWDRVMELNIKLVSLKVTMCAGDQQLGKLRNAAHEMAQVTAQWGRYYLSEGPAAIRGNLDRVQS